MTDVISKTQALPDGSMLWCVHHKGSYYDRDVRMLGQVPVDVRVFVLATDYEDARSKASSLQQVKDATKRSTDELQVEATIVAIESLIPARDCREDGRLGYHTTTPITRIGLSHPDDTSRWRLAVCLVPI